MVLVLLGTLDTYLYSFLAESLTLFKSGGGQITPTKSYEIIALHQPYISDSTVFWDVLLSLQIVYDKDIVHMCVIIIHSCL